MRAAPTIAVDGTLSHLGYTHTAAGFTATSLVDIGSGKNSYVIRIIGNGTSTTNAGAYARMLNASSALTFSAEL